MLRAWPAVGERACTVRTAGADKEDEEGNLIGAYPAGSSCVAEVQVDGRGELTALATATGDVLKFCDDAGCVEQGAPPSLPHDVTLVSPSSSSGGLKRIDWTAQPSSQRETGWRICPTFTQIAAPVRPTFPAGIEELLEGIKFEIEFEVSTVQMTTPYQFNRRFYLYLAAQARQNLPARCPYYYLPVHLPSLLPTHRHSVKPLPHALIGSARLGHRRRTPSRSNSY